VYEAFLNYAEKEVIEQLKKIEVTLTPEQLAFVRNDQQFRDACFGTFFPPDGRVILNLLELRHQLGDKMFNKYRDLCIVNAVIRRHVGVESTVNFGEKEEYWANGPNNPDKYSWHPYTFIEIKPQFLLEPEIKKSHDNTEKRYKNGPPKTLTLEEWLKTSAGARWADNKSGRQKGKFEKKYMNRDGAYPRLAAGYDRVKAYLEANNLQPGAFENPEQAKECFDAMEDLAPVVGKFTRRFWDEYMAYSGLRPKSRDSGPSVKEMIEFYDDLHTRWKANPSMYPGKRFPVESAPWPIMFPLAKGWPIREAENIVKRHEGKAKLQTYGKYQNKTKVLALRNKPFDWHEDSWQGIVQAGGVCHQMSSIGVGAYQAFGTPATKAGRGHHSFLNVFDVREEGFSSRTKQGSGGWSQWAFNDPFREAFTEYHQMLALAMSVGPTNEASTNSYMKTRVAVNVGKMLKLKGDIDLAATILKAGIEINCYNPELWFYLASYQGLCKPNPKDKYPGGLAINPDENQLKRAQWLALLGTKLESSQDKLVDVVEYDATTDFSQIDGEGEVITNRAEDVSRVVFRVGYMVGVVQPVEDRAANQKMYDLLRSVEHSSLPVAASLARLKIALEGWEKSSQDFLNLLNAEFSLTKEHQAKDEVVIGFREIVKAVPESDKKGNTYRQWLVDVAAVAETNPVFYRMKKTMYLNSLYGAVVPELLACLKTRNEQAEYNTYKVRFDATKGRLRNKSTKKARQAENKAKAEAAKKTVEAKN